MKKCFYCGQSLPEDSEFCPYCGAKSESSPISSPHTPPFNFLKLSKNKTHICKRCHAVFNENGPCPVCGWSSPQRRGKRLSTVILIVLLISLFSLCGSSIYQLLCIKNIQTDAASLQQEISQKESAIVDLNQENKVLWGRVVGRQERLYYARPFAAAFEKAGVFLTSDGLYHYHGCSKLNSGIKCSGVARYDQARALGYKHCSQCSFYSY